MGAGAKLQILIAAKDDSASALGKASSAIGGIAKAAVAAGLVAGAAIGGIALATVGAASDLAESRNKVKVVFGDMAGDIEDFAGRASTALGQSEQQALDATGTFGNLFTSMGMGLRPATDMSKGIVTLASDLASFNNIPVDLALEKLRAGLVGEVEPLRTLGVNLSAEAVQLKAVQMGLAKSTKEVSTSAKAQAAYALILEQTTNAQGDFARTADGLANRQRIMKAQFQDIRATIGKAFLPAFEAGTKAVTDLLGKMKDSGALDRFADALGKVVTGGVNLAVDAIKKLRDIFLTVRGVFRGEWVDSSQVDGLTRVFGNVATFVRDKIVPAVQMMIDVFKRVQPYLKYVTLAFALMGNPISIALTLIRAWTENWLGIQTKLQPVVDWLSTAIPAALETITSWFEGGDGGGAEGFVQGIIDAFTGMGEAIMGVVGPVIDFVAPSFERLWAAIGVFATDVAPELIGAFNAIKATIETVVVPALIYMATAYATYVGAIVGFVRDHADLLIGILKGMWTVLEGIVTTALAVLKGIIMIGLNLIQGDWEGAWDAFAEMYEGFWTGIHLITDGATEILKNVLSLAWEAIKAVAAVAWDGIKTQINTKWEEIKSNTTGVLSAYKTLISDAWEAIKSTAGTAWESVKSTISTAWDNIKMAVSTKAGELVAFLAELPGKMVAAIGNLGSLLWNAGASLIQGLIDGIVSKIGEVKRKLGELTGLLPGWKGPESADRLILFGAGQAVMEGFIGGLKSKFGDVKENLSGTLVDLVRSAMDTFTQMQTFKAVPGSIISSFADTLWAVLEAVKKVGYSFSASLVEQSARGMRALTDVIEPMLSAMDKLRGLTAIPTGSQIQAMKDAMWAVLEAILDVSRSFPEQLTNDIKRVAGLAGALVQELVNGMATALEKIRFLVEQSVQFLKLAQDYRGNMLTAEEVLGTSFNPRQFASIMPPRSPAPTGPTTAMTQMIGSTGGANNLASIEEAVYRGAYRGTRAALAEAI